ncbi:hypothetical protein HanRHA438_Chr08g0358381 [Helianthus annuus]|nr:hypothetical protein HanRHA438_Chr08g0358381 [Helianthus annuus]
MAATFPTPPVKKPTAVAAFQPRRRGKIKAQIFGGIAEAVASATSRARDFLSFKKSSPATPPPSPPRLMVVDPDDENEKVHVDFIILEKDP